MVERPDIQVLIPKPLFRRMGNAGKKREKTIGGKWSGKDMVALACEMFLKTENQPQPQEDDGVSPPVAAE